MRFSVCALFALLLLNAAVAQTPVKVIVLANSIDDSLAGDFYTFMTGMGVEVVHTTADRFDEYKNERFIIILGGQNAPEGVGGITSEILSEEEQESLLASNASKGVFVKKNHWSDKQTVEIVAGYEKEQTRDLLNEKTNEIYGAIKSEKLDVISGIAAIDIEMYEFSPNEIKVSAGTTVVWTNHAAVWQKIESERQQMFHSKTLKTGETYSYTFTKPGTYTYASTIRPQMRGTVTVIE